jgi:group II intron reverse transcriptase/maturase
MEVDELPAWLERNEGQLREQLLAARFRPMAVRKHEIPKSGGGIRTLGIPTVVDRLVQQAMLLVMQPAIDPTFSERSYGFRPGRSAQQAIAQALQYVRDGRIWVVDVDLEAFFDRVNHDVLMSRVARLIDDKRMLKTIRAFLEAGIMSEGVVMNRDEGTPQGGPLSPLLANILLDEVDKELEARGHAFVRYADDNNVYVRTQKAAQRVLESLRKTYARLRLRVNEQKSAAARVWDRKFLGFTFRRISTEAGREIEVAISTKAQERFRERVR